MPMTSTSAEAVRDIRYEPEEQPPPALALGLGFQFAMLAVAGIVLTPAIVVRAAGAARTSCRGQPSRRSRSAG